MSPAPLLRHSSAALLRRVAATTVAAGLVVVGLPAVALAADGTVSITSTNGLGGVTSASNTASVTLGLTTSSTFVYNQQAPANNLTVVVSRAGTSGEDAIEASVTSAASTPSVPGQANSFVVSVALTSANPGAYDVTVSGSTVTVPEQTDRCLSCFTVLSPAPQVTSVSPTTIARTGATTLTVQGLNFARGNYSDPAVNSNYACVTCAGAPKLEVRAHGASVADPGITLTDPPSGSTTVAVPATSTSMAKYVSVGESATVGAHDIYVENGDGQGVTLENALTVAPAMTITGISPATRGKASSNGEITITGTDFPEVLTAAVLVGSPLAADGKISYSLVRDSSTQVRLTNVAVAADAATGQRTIHLGSAATFDVVSSTEFSVTAAPVADARALPDSTLSSPKYGQGAIGVRVQVTGSGFTPGNGAAGAQIAFTPSTGITVVTQSATAGTVTAYVNIAPSATVGTGPELTVVNPDGGADACSTACRMAISAAPVITGVSPASGGRGQSQTVVLTGTNLADGTVKSAPSVSITNATTGATSASSATAATVTNVLASSTVTGAQDISIVNNDDQGRSTCTGCFTITNLGVTGTTNGSSLNNGTVLATATGHGFDPAATVSLVKTGAGLDTVPAIPGVVTVAPVASAPGAADGTSIQAQFALTGKDPGTYAFRVTNPDGTPYPGVGQGGLFNVVSAAPTASSVSPSSRGAGATGQTVVITGTGFGPNASVAFSNAAVHIDSLTRNSSTQLTLVVHVDQGAAADASGTVTVTNTDAQKVVKPFAVLTGPEITSLSPTSRGQGAASTGLVVVGAQGTFPATANASLTFVNGSGVTASDVVVTPGEPGPLPLPTDDELSATLAVASGATVGSYDVVLTDTSTGGRWVQSNGFTVHAKPTLASVTPGSGAVGTSVNVTLAGTGFLASPTVAATDDVTVSNVTLTSPTSVTATFTLPAGATPNTDVDVTLTNADGGFATLIDAFHLFGKPGAPTIGTATPGDAKATVAWTVPASDGGSAVTSYTVTASPGGATATVAAPAIQADVTGLTNGTAYTFTVRSTNAAGNGPESAATSPAVTPRTVPGKPTAVGATAGDKSASVSWTVPASNGGAPIASYTVTSSPGALSETVAGDQTGAVVTGLTNGVAYTFTVLATNAAGDGAASDPSAEVTPVSNATAPSQVVATPGDSEATVTWAAPDDDGGSTITSYIVTSTPGGLTATVAGDELSAVVTGLTNGTSYTFTVRADNGIPGNPESAASNAVTPRTAPGTPTGVAGTAGDRSVDVSWTAPADNGATITSYTVTTVQGGATTEVTGDPAATHVTVTGLTNGVAYTFTVHATNSAGDGAESVESAAVTPVTEPGAPTAVSATAGNAQATVSWTAPSDNGGAPVTGYTVTSSPGAKTCTTSGATSCTVTGLTQGSTYTFTVTATNAKGTGPASAASAPVTLSLPPDAPTNVSATAGDGQATLTWTAPASNGGSTVTSYTVTASPGGASVTVSGNPAPTTAAVTGLTNGTAYTFAVVAHNLAGTSAPGTSSAVTPSTKPGAPTSVAATAGDRTVKVTWAAPSSDGGAPVGFYFVKLNNGSPVVVDGATRSVTFSGLTNGTSYTATVTAQNSRGNGSAASATPVTPRYVVTATLARSASAVTYGGAVTLSGKLTRSNGSAMAGKAVRVYAKTYPATTYRLLTTRTTGSTGKWSYSTKPTRYTSYYALFTGDAAHQARKSSAIAVAVRFKVSVTSPSAGATVRAGTVSFRATVAPAIYGATGYLVHKRSDGRIVYLAKATVSSKGTWVLSRKLGRGTYAFAVQVNGYKGCATKRTAFFKLKVV
jgi:hypothetical protein